MNRKLLSSLLIVFFAGAFVGFVFFPLINTEVFHGASAPHSHIELSKIQKVSGGIFLQQPDIFVDEVPAEGSPSMLPCFGDNTKFLMVKPTSEEELHVGDVVAYKPNNSSDYWVTHRIIRIGKDKKGWYAITKGDNNPVPDKRVRFNQIKALVVGAIW